MHLKFRWTVSRRRDTYGYNICTLYVDGKKAARCNGGGYDMKGTCLGSWMARAYADRLRALRPAEMPENWDWQADRLSRYCRDCYRKDCDALGDKYPETTPEHRHFRDDVFTCPMCGGENTAIDREAGRRVSRGRGFYGLRFNDPNYDPGKATIGADTMDSTLGGGADGMTVEEAEAAGKSIGLERYQAVYRASSPVPTERHTIPSIDGACGFSCVETIGRAIGITLEYLPSRKKDDTAYLVHDARAAGSAAA